MLRRSFTPALLLILAATPVTQADIVHRETSEVGPVVVEELATGLGVPWGMEFLDEEQLLITERAGRVQVLDLGSRALREVTGLPSIRQGGQGGLLDVASTEKAPGWYYFTRVGSVENRGVTILSRARLQGDRLTGWEDLLVTRSGTGSGRHFGSRIAFDGDGHVYFSTGDRGERPNGQNLQTHAGTIMRLTLDGQVPPDNPFIGKAGALPEIWSYGHRNPQGLAYDAGHDRLWENEHGPRGGDEINLIQRGANYGWAELSYGKEYWGPIDVGEGEEAPGMVSPVKVYIPSIAPGSLLHYTGDAFPQWRDNLFSGALALRHLNRVSLDESGNAVAEERLLEEMDERIRALEQGPDGAIYLSTDSGRILRLKPASGE
ncbi:PQQ-dependent sugar dehydrogenase [Marinobacterium sp. YM272]|uniref:PQQ-dependent sugar dehydrogenase n=1 Tax=Marinobacterium sp. YM272 TaxID=3421654 RepID=UPI003D7FBDBA